MARGKHAQIIAPKGAQNLVRAIAQQKLDEMTWCRRQNVSNFASLGPCVVADTILLGTLCLAAVGRGADLPSGHSLRCAKDDGARSCCTCLGLV